MTVPDLVARMKAAGNRADVIARLIGYIAMIQHLGWDNLPCSRVTRFELQRTFRHLEIDPLKLEL
jgi:hypothetical protein